MLRGGKQLSLSLSLLRAKEIIPRRIFIDDSSLRANFFQYSFGKNGHEQGNSRAAGSRGDNFECLELENNCFRSSAELSLSLFEARKKLFL